MSSAAAALGDYDDSEFDSDDISEVHSDADDTHQVASDVTEGADEASYNIYIYFLDFFSHF